MTAYQGLEQVREQIERDIAFHEKEIARLQKALEATQTVESYLSQDSRQSKFPEARPYADLKPDDLVLAIIESKDKAWTVRQIIQEAKIGGHDVERWKNPYNFLYNYVSRLIDKGLIEEVPESHPKRFRRVQRPDILGLR
jgi:hypothetical protein